MTEPAATQQVREEVRAKRISTEDMVRAQVDRINGIRSDVTNPNRVAAWSEAVEALADLLLPWYDEPGEADLFHKEWADRKVAVVTTTGGQIVVPTARDCREAQQILMRLAKRHGLLVRTRTVSGPMPRVFPAKNGVVQDQDDTAPQVAM